MKILVNGKYVDTDCDKVVDVDGQGTIFVTLSLGMAGGKGGFGSMLRAIGAQIEKTTNKEACRDLSGRRIRDVNIERRFQNWIAKAAERKKEQMKRKKERLERLRRVPKFEFKDDEYFKARSEIPEKIDAALEYALKKTKNKSTASATVTSATVTSATVTSATVTSATVTSETRQPSTSTACETQKSESKPKNAPVPLKRKFLTKLGLSKKPRMWISEDLEVSDEEEPEGNGNLNVAERIVRTGEKVEETVVQVHPEPEVLKADNVKIPEPVDVKETEIVAKETEIAAKETEIVAKETEIVVEETDQEKTRPELVKEEAVKKEVEPEKLDLESYNSKEELVALGLDRLKAALLFLGMKCGGTLEQRADRLWSVRGLDISKIPKNLLPPKNKK